MGATISKNLYDTDFVEWTARTATLLREGRIDELDIENVAEEIESLGKSDRGRSRLGLARMLFQLIMQKFEQGSRTAIFEERIIIANILEDSPSLRQHLQDNLDGIYARAV